MWGRGIWEVMYAFARVIFLIFRLLALESFFLIRSTSESRLICKRALSGHDVLAFPSSVYYSLFNPVIG